VAIEGDKSNMTSPADYDRNAKILERLLGELSPIPSWHVCQSDEMKTDKYPFPPTVYEIKCKLEINGETLGLSKRIAIEFFDLLGTEEVVRRLNFQFADTFGAKVFCLDKQAIDGRKV
jgi:hypothetical protein